MRSFPISALRLTPFALLCTVPIWNISRVWYISYQDTVQIRIIAPLSKKTPLPRDHGNREGLINIMGTRGRGVRGPVISNASSTLDMKSLRNNVWLLQIVRNRHIINSRPSAPRLIILRCVLGVWLVYGSLTSHCCLLLRESLVYFSLIWWSHEPRQTYR